VKALSGMVLTSAHDHRDAPPSSGGRDVAAPGGSWGNTTMPWYRHQ